MKDKEFKLHICNFFPESLFVETYGRDVFELIKTEAFRKDLKKCAGCGYEPRTQEGKDKDIFVHIYSVDKENPANSKGRCLCSACHSTQHIVSSLERGLVVFVNSSFSQADLVRGCRSGNISGMFKDNQIIKLKKSPEKFRQEFFSGDYKISNSLKVIFTDNFKFEF